MFESIAWQIMLNSLGTVVAIAGVLIVGMWAYSEITYLKNKVKNLK